MLQFSLLYSFYTVSACKDSK